MSMRLEYCKLGEVIDITSGKECPPEKKTKTKTIPIMGANGIIGNSVEFIYDGPIILVGRVGSCGEVHRVDFPCWPSDNTLVITPKNNADFDYIEYCLRYGDFYPWISGSTQPLLTQTAVKRMEIPWPANEIREKIGNYGRKIDEMIISNSQLNAYTQELISALFRSWFIDFDPVKAKAEGKLPNGMDEETAALFPDSFENSEIGPIPSGWPIGTIHDIAKQRKDIAKPDVFNEMLPYIGLEHMPRNSIALTEWGVSEGLESNKFRYSKKDILFGKLRPYFHKVGPAPLEGVCSTDILVIQPIDEELGGFLLPILSSEHFVNFVSGISEGVGLPRTKWGHFKLYKIALPPVEIREKFVSFVDPMLQIIESSIHESKGLEHARDALLPRLMSGELSVS